MKDTPAPEDTTMTTQQPATKTVQRGFPGLQCFHCGHSDCVSLKLEDLALSCGECDVEITREEVDEHLARWQAVSRWLDAAPPTQ